MFHSLPCLDVFNYQWQNIQALVFQTYLPWLLFHSLSRTTHSLQSLARSSLWVLTRFLHQKQEPTQSSSCTNSSSVTGFSSCLCLGKVFYLIIFKYFGDVFDYTMVVPLWGKSRSRRRCLKHRLLWPLQPFNLKVNLKSLNFIFHLFINSLLTSFGLIL